MKKILVIDDDELVNDMLKQLLTEAGHEVECALDGVVGLELFAAQAFDLVITDIVMPNKEGLETTIEIRDKNKTIPIITISGGGKINADEYLDLAKRFGANYVFKKPIDIAPFLVAVERCLS